MERRSALLPFAAVLSACLWVVSASAQEMAPAASVEPRRDPLAVQDPGGARVGAAASVGEDAERLSDPGSGGAAQVRVRALAAMEALREEIVTLAALQDAQAALLAWNREGAKTGAPVQALPARLCRDLALAAWCPLLPATFGAPSTEDGDD